MNTETEAPQEEDEAAPPLGDLQERFAPKIEEAKQQLQALNERAKTFIRENPGTSLLAAAGLGYLIGKLASRK